jgi:hypothetical protein
MPLTSGPPTAGGHPGRDAALSGARTGSLTITRKSGKIVTIWLAAKTVA